jgi:Flp pilus assembly protein TadB
MELKDFEKLSNEEKKQRFFLALILCFFVVWISAVLFKSLLIILIGFIVIAILSYCVCKR